MLMKTEIRSQHGQALIELIVFLPLMITLYSVIGGFANSINGSINQQKITRAYFYYRIQNNSTIPGTRSGDFSSWSKFGMFYIGWKDKFENGDQPIMPCYKISIPMRNDPSDECTQAYSDNKTLWIRVGTVYGICGATYVNRGSDRIIQVPDALGLTYGQALDQDSCLIRQ
jgi:hypothetical protein